MMMSGVFPVASLAPERSDMLALQSFRQSVEQKIQPFGGSSDEQPLGKLRNRIGSDGHRARQADLGETTGDRAQRPPAAKPAHQWRKALDVVGERMRLLELGDPLDERRPSELDAARRPDGAALRRVFQ